jgi:hypothetical protein
LPDNDRRTRERRSPHDRRLPANGRQRGPFINRRRHRLLRRIYRLIFAGMIDMDFRAIRRHVYLLICMAFELVILFLWWSAILDLPHRYYGMPARPFYWAQPTVQTIWLLLLLLFVLAVLRVFFKQIRYLEGFLPVCSVCKSIRVGDDWVPLEEYLHAHSDVRMTHSLCGPCAKQYYDYDEEEEGG